MYRPDRQSRRPLFQNEESRQLCESPLFRSSCQSGRLQQAFPSGPSRQWADRICRSCGHEKLTNGQASPSHDPQSSPRLPSSQCHDPQCQHHGLESYDRLSSSYASHPQLSHHQLRHELHHESHHELLDVLSDPEELHERKGFSSWEAPYVWETNFF